MDVIWAIYATPGKQYATGKNPFGRDCLGYQWASNGAEATQRFAEKRDLDVTAIEY